MDIATFKVYLISAYRSLPLLLISFIFLMALGLASLNFAFLLLGHLLIYPLIYLAQPLLKKLVVVLPGETIPSFWTTHISFFLFYIITNAASLYTMPAESGANETYVEHRKLRAIAVLAITMFTLILFFSVKYYTTGQTYYDFVIGFGIGGFLGYGMFQLASLCGVGYADVFGTMYQMKVTNDTNTAMVCGVSGS